MSSAPDLSDASDRADNSSVSASALFRELKTLEKAVLQGNDAVLERCLAADDAAINAMGDIADRHNLLRRRFFAILQRHCDEDVSSMKRLPPALLAARVPASVHEAFFAELRSIDDALHAVLLRIGALTPDEPTPSPPQTS